MKKNMLFLAALTLLLTANAFANVKAQAGDIHQGREMKLTADSGIASYYAHGKAGNVQFSCELKGKPNDACSTGEVHAVLRPGKNFNNIHNSPFTLLKLGQNGSYTWTLVDTGEENGNIKVFYSCGDEVKVRCIASK